MIEHAYFSCCHAYEFIFPQIAGGLCEKKLWISVRREEEIFEGKPSYYLTLVPIEIIAEEGGVFFVRRYDHCDFSQATVPLAQEDIEMNPNVIVHKETFFVFNEEAMLLDPSDDLLTAINRLFDLICLIDPESPY